MSGGRSSIGLALPQAKGEYDESTLQRLIDYVRELEEQVYMRNTHLEIYSPPKAGSGGRQPLFILRSPDGERWSITVSNLGVLSATAAGIQGQSL